LRAPVPSTDATPGPRDALESDLTADFLLLFTVVPATPSLPFVGTRGLVTPPASLGTSGDIVDSLRESRMSFWRPCSLAARVDAISRVSDNYRVKRFSEIAPMTVPERLNDTERKKADGEAVLRHAFHGEP
jgi:hypothetical protein